MIINVYGFYLKCMKQIYEIKTDKEKMIDVLNLIIEVYRDDYSIIDGESKVFYKERDSLLKEIEEMKTRK